MPSANNIRGIYLAIELNTKEIKAQTKQLTAELQTEFTKIAGQLNLAPNLNLGKIETDFGRIAVGLTSLKKQIDALGDAQQLRGLVESTDLFKDRLEELSKTTGVAKERLRALFGSAIENNAIEGQVQAVRNLSKALHLTGAETVALAKEMGLTGRALEIVEEKMNKTAWQAKSLGEVLKNIMFTNNPANAIQSAVATLGVNISLAGMVELGKAAVRTSVEVQSLNTAFNSIYGDADKAGDKLSFIREETNRLGLEYYETAKAAKSFYAAAKTTTIADDADKIFSAFSEASSALHLTKEETSGVFLALSQMMSKGKITAEELRQQLGERLPGAVQILAKAMKISTGELDKMMQGGNVGLENLVKMADEVHNLYGKVAEDAGKMMLGQMNRISTAWTDIKANIINTDALSATFKSVADGMQYVAKNADSVKSVIFSLSQAFMVLSTAAVMQTIVDKATASWKAFTETAKNAGGALNLLKNSVSGINIGIGTALGAVIGGFVAYISYIKSTRTEFEQLIDKFRDGTESIEQFNKELEKTSDTRMLGVLSGRIDEIAQKSKESMDSMGAYLEKTISIQQSLIGTKDSALEVEDALTEEQIRSYEELGAKREDQIQILNRLLSVVKSGSTDFNGMRVSVKEAETALKAAGMEAQEVDYIVAAMLKTISQSEKAAAHIAELRGEMDALKQTAEAAGVAMQSALTFKVKDLDTKLLEAQVKNAFVGNKLGSQFAEALASSASVSKVIGTEVKEGIKLTKEEIIAATSEFSKFKDTTKGVEAAEKKLNAMGIVFRDGMRDEIIKLAEKNRLTLDTSTREKELTSSKKAGAKATKELENKTVSYSNAMKDLEVELARIKDASENGTKTFAYQWESTRKAYDSQLAKLRDFEDKYSKVMSPEQMDKARKLYTELANAKWHDAQNKLLDSYKEKFTSVLNAYYEKHGGVNTLALEKAKQTYEDDVAAFYEMYEKKRITMEQYFAAEAAAREQLNEKQYEEEKKGRIAQGLFAGDTGKGMRDAFDEWKKGVLDMEAVSKSFTTSALDGMTSGLENVINGTKTASEAFRDFSKSMVAELVKLIAKMLIYKAIQSSLGWGAKESGGAYSGEGSYNANFNFGAGLSLGGKAFGGAYNGGSLSSFANGVYNTPTYFTAGAKRFANGGVFGEAGPEAIMPLTRMPNGRLGVAAAGGSAEPVQVNVYNYGKDKASVSEGRTSSGGKSIDVIIGDIVAGQMSTPGTRLNRAMNAQTQTQNPVIRR